MADTTGLHNAQYIERDLNLTIILQLYNNKKMCNKLGIQQLYPGKHSIV